MTAAPLVTIVVPTWNRAALVREAVASVIAQTYRHWELIVVDDGSSDDTVAALRAMAEPRLRIVALAHEGNVARLRNIGAASGGGAFVAFLDSDDLWLPRKLELQLAALGSGSARWCYSNYAHVDADRTPIPARAGAFRPDNGRILRPLLAGETAAFIGTLLVERGLFDSVGGFDESMAHREDFDFELRLAAAAEAVVVPEIAALVREHPSRKTGSIARPHEGSAIAFEKFLARETDPALRRIARAKRAGLLADAGLLRLARRDLAGGVRLLARAALGGGAWYIAGRLAARISRRRDPRKGAGTSGQ